MTHSLQSGPGEGDARATPPLEPAIAFAASQAGSPAIEIVVNFGLFVGREASAAEIDRLGTWLLDRVDRVTIVAEARHEIGAHAEALVHQVRIEVDDPDRARIDEIERELLSRAEHWLRLCAAERAANNVLTVGDGV